eukprot:gene2526-2828_t
MQRLVGFVALVLVLQSAQGFYLPGVAPQDFKQGDPLSLKVNKLSSIKTQLPYEYYSLPFCRPAKIVRIAENLGEVLRGDRIENSVYQIKMRTEEQCKVLCKIDKLSKEQSKAFRAKIEDDYKVNMILDNLPVAMVKYRVDENGNKLKGYERGYYVGLKAVVNNNDKDLHLFLNNHLRFNILYNVDAATDLSRIVGFEVEAFSVRHEYEEDKTTLKTCNPAKKVAVSHQYQPQSTDEGSEVVFTYDVMFTMYAGIVQQQPNRPSWPTLPFGQCRMVSIINSVMIVLFLTCMVAMIMIRTLYRDISKYNQLESQEEAAEETGWKLVHGDVFRAPEASSMLSSYVGVGVQLLGMLVVTMVFALLGFLSPSNRGGLMTAMLLMFVFMGCLAGYSSSRLYKALRGDHWRQMTLRTALMFPGIVFVVFFLLDLLLWSEKSSGAVPFGTLMALCFLWFGVSVPLVFVGSYYGFKQPAPDEPVRTNKIPRQIPEQPWYMHPVLSCMVGAVLPFGAVFIELFFILTSVWLHQFYYLFGFIALVFVILCITCAEISIVLCYFQLCSEDYHWWWRAYLTSGTSAIYMFLYSSYYFYSKLTITKFVPMLVYFTYMSVFSYGFFCLTGTIGFYACYWFVNKIYGAIKID